MRFPHAVEPRYRRPLQAVSPSITPSSPSAGCRNHGVSSRRPWHHMIIFLRKLLRSSRPLPTFHREQRTTLVYRSELPVCATTFSCHSCHTILPAETSPSQVPLVPAAEGNMCRAATAKPVGDHSSNIEPPPVGGYIRMCRAGTGT